MDKVEEILADIKAFVNAQVEGLTPNEQTEVYESLIADLTIELKKASPNKWEL